MYYRLDMAICRAAKRPFFLHEWRSFIFCESIPMIASNNHPGRE
ncbi:MAG: hypothetical protein AB4080_22270 [Trichodesmium sp.]